MSQELQRRPEKIDLTAPGREKLTLLIQKLNFFS